MKKKISLLFTVPFVLAMAMTVLLTADTEAFAAPSTGGIKSAEDEAAAAGAHGVYLADAYDQETADEANVCEHQNCVMEIIKKATPEEDGYFSYRCLDCGEINDEYGLEDGTISRPAKIVFKDEYVYNGKAIKPNIEVYQLNANRIEPSDYTVSYKNNKNPGIATITVTFQSDYYSGVMTRTFTIKPRTPEIGKGARYTKGKIILKWKRLKEADGYLAQISLKGNFKGAKTIKIKSNKTTEKAFKHSIKPLQHVGSVSKWIHFRMRSYKKVKINGKTKTLYSDWQRTLYPYFEIRLSL